MGAVHKGMTYRASDDPSGWGMFEMNFHAAGKVVLALEDASAGANSVTCLCTCCNDTVSVDPAQLSADTSSQAPNFRQQWLRQQPDQDLPRRQDMQPPKLTAGAGANPGYTPDSPAGYGCLVWPLLLLIWVFETIMGFGKRLRIEYLLLLLGLLCFFPLQIPALIIGWTLYRFALMATPLWAGQ
jgi:hypothetical protein